MVIDGVVGVAGSLAGILGNSGGFGMSNMGPAPGVFQPAIPAPSIPIRYPRTICALPPSPSC